MQTIKKHVKKNCLKTNAYFIFKNKNNYDILYELSSERPNWSFWEFLYEW